MGARSRGNFIKRIEDFLWVFSNYFQKKACIKKKTFPNSLDVKKIL